ncbi:MAG: hypothetical protein M1840_001907 [Geoglossum simile]|nr:MAG: hypothetical protein M1840_001907 [Geoglossum simile]
MRLFSAFLALALATEVVVAGGWFNKAAYNQWHQTELEQWLSDHDIPYPKPASRKDLENIVKENWRSKVSSPYTDWDSAQLQQYLKERGFEAQDGAKKSKEALINQVKKHWYETEEQAEDAWGRVADWIFDSWSDSQLQAFLDKHGISYPQPRKRDTLLSAARQNYESVCKEVGDGAAYPGNWLYGTWSISELRAWLSERGHPVLLPTTRGKLIAYVRRNSRLASLQFQGAADSAAASARATKDSASDRVFDSWSDSQIKRWADRNGIKIPQGSKRNELLAIARRHKALLTGDNIYTSASSVYGAATSKAGNQYARASDDAQMMVDDAFDRAINSWSETRLKAYLDSRGVPVPQAGKRDELLAKVRLQKHKAATSYSAWTFDAWTTGNLRAWLASQGNKAADQTSLTRDELLKQAQESYASASVSGESAFASLTSALASATEAAKDFTFDTWSDSDLKSYLDSYGIPVYQGSTTNELRALARRHYTYFRYGTNTPSGTIYAKFKDGVWWVLGQLRIVAAKGQEEMEYQTGEAADRVKDGATCATNKASEEAQKAKHWVQEEL